MGAGCNGSRLQWDAPVGANLVFAPVLGARHASTDSKAGEYKIRPYVTISERVASELSAFSGQQKISRELPAREKASSWWEKSRHES
jgi:hypothetical protein